MEKTGKKPNIIMILADDQGPWAMHCAGTPELYTPNLDRIAEQGMRFDSFFCASPVCSPARASILTGKMPYNDVGRNNSAGKHHRKHCQKHEEPLSL